jgi:farnesyl-diphosphate farnesyltransferase
MAYAQHELLTRLLQDVSRSFYLTLRVLPAAIRPQIGLAYLLARTTDTIADTDLISVEQRLEALELLRNRIAGTSSLPINFSRLAPHQGTPAERVLLEKCESSLALIDHFSPEDRELVREVLRVIAGGQELDLRRFAGATRDNIIALQTDAELDDYTFRVAGCVGEFWTRLCLRHLYASADLPAEELLAKGVRFGKGLQLVNILRDIPGDLQQGRCYIPSERLIQAGLTPQSLSHPAHADQFRPVFHQYLDRADEFLCAGWDYTNMLPWYSMRVRLACAWPVLIGQETIGLLRSVQGVDPGQRVKVSRARVKRILWRSALAYPWPAAWRRLGEKSADSAAVVPGRAGGKAFSEH